MNPLENTQYVTFQLVYKLSDNTFRTLGYLIKINKDDLETLKSNLLFFHLNDFDEYNEVFKETIAIYIKYRYLNMSKVENKPLLVDVRKNKNITTHLINKVQIPSMYDTNQWGIIKYKKDKVNFTIYSIIRGNYRFEVIQTLSSRDITIFNENNNLILEFNDKFESENYFIRTIKNTHYHFKDDKIVLNIKENKNTKFISKVKQDNVINQNIITLDLETSSSIINNEEVLNVISACIYDGENKLSFYLSDYNSSDDMLRYCINYLMITKYNGYKVYIHNLSRFDGIFLIKILATMNNSKLIPIIKDDKMIALTLKFGKCKITFHDSMLLLPSSLDNLSKAFNVLNKKEIFPIYWLLNNPKFNLGYIGTVPEMKYFKNITINEYNNYVLERFNKWNFRIELLNYNMIDCIALYEILITFNQLIFEKFSLNAFNYPTLPSLAFAVYRSSFINDYKIPKIGGKMLHDIRKSYTGGSTDMYIPYGEKIWCYDINSLYPTAMKQFKYPTGKFISFNNLGNLSISELENLLNKKELFGFIEVEVNCPEDIVHPILQIRREISPNSPRTFSPIGSFTGWFHTEEILEAIKLGYKINIISGYLFEEAEIFNNYVDDLYRIKVEADKNKDPIWRLISKNLMNSLYGRFGMDQYLVNNTVIDKDDIQIEKLLEKIEIEDIIELDDKLLIQYLPAGFNTYSYQENLDINISVPIAASVTAYSRILMAKFKNNLDYTLHYTDTDSLYLSFKSNLDKENFDKQFVDPLKLGYLKIENPKINGEFTPYERFYFLGPKFYVGILNNEIDFGSKTKIRGLQKAYRSLIDEDKIKSLLDYNRKPIKIETMKWYKDISESKIILENRPYQLDVSMNKRCLIYKYNSADNIKLIDTSSIIMKENKIEYKGNYFVKDNKIYKETPP